jgi:hypothetical protein
MMVLAERPGSLIYRAGGLPSRDSVLKQNFHFEDGNLVVKGTIVGTVCELLTDPFTDTKYMHDTGKDISVWTRRAITSAYKSSLFDISVSESWEKWARTMNAHYTAIHKAKTEEKYSPQAYVKNYELFLRLFVDNP